MGRIADKLTARLHSLIARSEETERLTAQARCGVQAAITEMDCAARALHRE